MKQASTQVSAPTHGRNVSGICPVYVRCKSGHVPDIYRTSTEQRLKEHRRYTEATVWIGRRL